MGLKKIQLVAQIVGFVTIGLLSISGVLAIASGNNPAWAALGQASPSMSPRVPDVINYQGMLRWPDGSVINGTYTMTFRLYDLPVGGNLVHTEQLSNVVVRDGLFTVLLGDGDGNPIQAATFKGPLYVGVQVGNDAEMQPRQRIAPVPYAVQLTDGVYVDESGQVGIGKTDPGATLDVNGNAHMSGYVGIGNTNPQAKLEVNGDIIASSLTISGTKPVLFRYMELPPNMYAEYKQPVEADTQVSAAEYTCAIVGMDAGSGRLHTQHSGLLAAYPYIPADPNPNWWIAAWITTRWEYPGSDPPDWRVWVMCVDNNLVDRGDGYGMYSPF